MIIKYKIEMNVQLNHNMNNSSIFFFQMNLKFRLRSCKNLQVVWSCLLGMPSDHFRRLISSFADRRQ
jgi:hypothetical protein